MKAPGSKLQAPEKPRIPSARIFNRQRTKKINTRLLQQIIASLLGESEIGKVELGISLVGAKEMAVVNWKFLRHAGSTDVITFDYRDNGRTGSPLPAAGAHGVTRPTLHGEIFICVDEAISQSKQFATTWQSEIVRYLVHGVLHLLGHDDRRPAARRRMKREEARWLRELAGKFSLAQIGRP